MAVAFIVVVVMLFATVLLWEDEPGLKGRALRPAGLFMWLIAGNWIAKLGGLLVTLGTGALLRYLMLNIELPVRFKILAGVVIAAATGLSVTSVAVGGSRWMSGYFPMQKLEKIRPSRSSLVNSPVISFSACWAPRSSSATSSPARRSWS